MVLSAIRAPSFNIRPIIVLHPFSTIGVAVAKRMILRSHNLLSGGCIYTRAAPLCWVESDKTSTGPERANETDASD
jgi:hypothetical protein